MNAGKATIAGFEVDASASAAGFKVDLGYTYLHTELQQLTVPPIPAGAPYSAFIPTAVVGGPLAQAPSSRLTLGATYTLPLSDGLGKLSVGVNFIHTSRQVITQATLGPDLYASIIAANGKVPLLANYLGSGPVDLRYLPQTDLVNLNVNWNDVMGKPIDVAFFVTNLTNQIYPIAIGQSYNSAGFESLLYGAPRMWGFRVKYRFGGN